MSLLFTGRKCVPQINIIFKNWFNVVRRASTNMTLFVEKQLDLLEIEHLSEIEQNSLEKADLPLRVLQRKGICVPKLVINSLKTGLYDRSIATFSLRTLNKAFPFNILSVGDIVRLNQSDGEQIVYEDCSGIVTKVTDKQISVAFDSLSFRERLDNLNQHGNSVALIKVANKVTYERLKGAMKDLGSYSNGPAQHLIEVLFGNANPLATHEPVDVRFYNDVLNKCQRETVLFALAQRELAIIHGPPGTGKTTTIIEIIAQLIKSGQKVLACAPSNVAVDNLLEKLSVLEIGASQPKIKMKSHQRKLKLVRLGHPARILDSKLQELSLDALIYRSGTAAIIRDVRADIEQIQAKLLNCRDKSQRNVLRQERKNLMAELRKREKKAIHDIIFPADVVLATNVGAYPNGPLQNIKRDHFDVVIIDECGQALEAACWIPLLKARKCILAGDHLQLPPTIVSEAAAEGLSLTILERLINLHGDKVVRMLTEQYRMHHLIMDWASKQMYEGKLTAHNSVKNHLLKDIPEVDDTEDTNIPLLLIDTAGCDMFEAESEESDSKANEGEAKIVFMHVSNLIQAGLDPEDIAVISPYNLQVDILRHIFHDKYPRLEVKSVDGFQGREKEAVVLSLVRSNIEGEVGFLSDKRRLNVAVTRARRHLAVVCDSETVSKNAFIKSLLDHMTDHGDIRSGFDYSNFIENEDDCVFDCIQSFNLMPVSFESNKLQKEKTKTTKHEADDYSKSCKAKKKASRNEASSNKSRSPASEVASNIELKHMFRTIMLKYMKIFAPKQFFENSSKFQSYFKEDQLDYSEALNIDINIGDRTVLFPSSLTPLERKMVHELCDEFLISHRSIGEGRERKVIVHFSSDDSRPTEDSSCMNNGLNKKIDEEFIQDETKPVQAGSRHFIAGSDNGDNMVKPLAESIGLSTGLHPNTSEDASDISYVECSRCGKTLPKDNIHLHSTHCERIMAVQMRMEKTQQKKEVKARAAPKSDKMKKKKTKNTSKHQGVEVDEDFDDLINEAISSNRSCCHDNCTTSVTTTGQICMLCKRAFCLGHILPEVHGCGEKSRVNARRQISRDGILYAGSGVPDRKLATKNRAVIKNKLSTKLRNMEASRKSSKDKK